jgi:hypothetical protein
VLITVIKLSLVLVTIAKPLFGIKVVRALMKQKVKSNGRGVKTSVEFLSKVRTPTPVHSFVNIRDR